MIKMIYFTSDLHINHDREFIWKERGYKSVDEMNHALVDNINSVVREKDTLYILGDVMLNKSKQKESIELLKSIICQDIHIIVGNHDTDERIKAYGSLQNVKEVCLAKRLKYGKYHLYLCHYPTMTGNLEAESLTQVLICLYGHTHQNTNFYKDIPFIYHVGVDSHKGMPVEINEIIEEIKKKAEECKELL